MRISILAVALASTAALGACTANPRTNADIATGAAVGAAGGAVVGAVAPGISTIAGAALGAAAGAVLPGVSIPAGAVIGAAVGGLAGAIWADRNNDGVVDGYVYNGQ